MIIQHNIMAINSHRQLGINNKNLSNNLEKLSSGYRINRAADDAAGLAISEKMRAQITGIDRAVLNAQDGASLIQTAEGALTEVHGMLNRLVELATQSANGTIQADDRQKIEAETKALKEEIDRISEATNFNGIKLLDGSLSSSGVTEIKIDNMNTTFNNAVAGRYTLTVGTAQYTAATVGNTLAYSVSLNDGTSVSFEFEVIAGGQNGQVKIGDSTYDFSTNITATDLAGWVKTELAKDTAFAEKFKISGTGNAIVLDAKEAGTKAPKVMLGQGSYSGAAIAGATFATTTPAANAYKHGEIVVFDGTNEESAVFSVNGVKFALVGGTDAAHINANIQALRDKGVNVLPQGTANDTVASEPDAARLASMINQKTGLNVSSEAGVGGVARGVLRFEELENTGKGLTMQVGDTAEAFNKITVSVENMSSMGIGIAGISMATQESSAAALDAIKSAIEKVSVNRGNLGALQNRLDHTINNLNVTSENMTAAESRIRDVDMAKEMMAFTKNNVLSQAAQAMLAQANMQPQQVLQLLR